MDALTSPKPTRWALLKPFDVYAKDGSGDVYLHRLRILQTPWFAIYLHDINMPDGDRHPHDHPWNFWSLILRGGYEEEVFCKTGDDERTFHPQGVRYNRRWKSWTWHHTGMDVAHRIRTVEPRTKTLVFTGPRHDTWYFWTEDGPVEWMNYIEPGDTSEYPAPA